MLNINDDKITSPVRQIKAKAELLNNSAISAYGKYVTFENPIPTEKVKVKVASKNLCQTINAYSNVTINNGVITQITADTTSGWIKCTSFQNGTYIGVLGTGTKALGIQSVTFEKDDTFNQVCFGIGGIARDTLVRIDVSNLPNGTYTISGNFTNIEQGTISWKDMQIEKGSTATEYTPYMPIEGGKGDLYYEGVSNGLTSGDGLYDSGIYTVSDWYWDDSGEMYIYFTDGNNFAVTTNGLGYETNEEFLADYEIPIGTQLYYDTETDSLYRITEGMVGNTITVGNQNLFNENKDYGNTIAVLEENGEKVFTHSYYDREGVNREYVGFNITDIWQLAYDRGLRLTISFDIKAAIDGEVQVYTLGKMELSRINGNRFNNVTTEWQRLSYTAIPYYISNAENGEKCTLSFYGTYYTGCVPFVKNIQIEIGETVTDYVPYQSKQYTIDETLTIEAEPYTPITVIYPDNNNIFIEKAECVVCACDNTYTSNDSLQMITIDRIGDEGKFFGYGISQKLNVKLIDIERKIETTTDKSFYIYFGTDEYINNFPQFYISETHRDENTNAISVTAYDVIKQMEEHTIAEIPLVSYTLREFAEYCGKLFGLSLEIQGIEDQAIFDLYYEAGANFEPTDTIRYALNGLAEATQTIYYVTQSKLIFKRLDKNAAAALTIGKADYVKLQSGENRRLQAICVTNELGNDITASISAIGTTQFIRTNPFLEMREDVADILDKAIADVGGMTINQFSCSWRGNYLLECGDKIDLITKDDDTITSYVINDSITYNGAYSHITQWKYTDIKETAMNPTTLGEALNMTFAKVDKVSKEITILASEIGADKEAISLLQIDTNGIKGSVSSLAQEMGNTQDELSSEIATIKNKVDAQITPEDVTLSIQKELSNGVSKVETSTGFKFNEEGLTISKSNSEISTQITEDGMSIKKGSKEVLTATNEGVKAQDLHATTFLIIGKNSRFEDMGKRTACFWIGG